MAVEMDPEEAPEGEEVQKPKKAKSKLLLIVIIGVLLLALIGVGGIIVFKFVTAEKNGEETVAETTEEKKDPSKLGAVVALDPFIVNLTGESGKRYLKVTIQVELNDEKVGEELTNKMPQIKDSIITVLSSKVTGDLLTIEGKFKLKEEILTRINRILTMGVVKNVYYVEFVIQ